jgi:hypothetical protein
LVEHQLPKLRVASSSLVSRSVTDNVGISAILHFGRLLLKAACGSLSCVRRSWVLSCQTRSSVAYAFRCRVKKNKLVPSWRLNQPDQFGNSAILHLGPAKFLLSLLLHMFKIFCFLIYVAGGRMIWHGALTIAHFSGLFADG